jgi:hypothetical protein
MAKKSTGALGDCQQGASRAPVMGNEITYGSSE